MSHKIDNQLILESALELAKRHGFVNLRREEIARFAGVSVGKVTNAFGSMKKLRRAVMRQAIRLELLDIIAEGIVFRDPCALKIPEELKVKALNSI